MKFGRVDAKITNNDIKWNIYKFEIQNKILRCLIRYTAQHVKDDIQFGSVDAKITKTS